MKQFETWMSRPVSFWDPKALENASHVHELVENKRLDAHFLAAKLAFKEKTREIWPTYCLLHPNTEDLFRTLLNYTRAWEKSQTVYMETFIVPTPAIPAGLLVMRHRYG